MKKTGTSVIEFCMTLVAGLPIVKMYLGGLSWSTFSLIFAVIPLARVDSPCMSNSTKSNAFPQAFRIPITILSISGFESVFTIIISSFAKARD